MNLRIKTTQQVVILISSYRDRFYARRALACLLGLLFSAGLMHEARVLSQTVQQGLGLRWLEEGKPIERQLSGGQLTVACEAGVSIKPGAQAPGSDHKKPARSP
jgi:hypothetical protein